MVNNFTSIYTSSAENLSNDHGIPVTVSQEHSMESITLFLAHSFSSSRSQRTRKILSSIFGSGALLLLLINLQQQYKQFFYAALLGG